MLLIKSKMFNLINAMPRELHWRIGKRKPTTTEETGTIPDGFIAARKVHTICSMETQTV